MEIFDAYIDELNNSIPPQYNTITGYYRDAYIDYQFYRPDRRPSDDYPPLRDTFVEWKENLDPSGLSININYVGATSRELVYNDENASLFDFNPALDHAYEVSDVGVKSHIITYQSKETSFNINVLENNKFIVLYEAGNVLHTEVLEASASNIESVLDTAIQSGYTGFYKFDALGYYDSKNKYDKAKEQTLTKEQALLLFKSFTGGENIFIGTVIKAPTPTPPEPTPTPPYNPGGGSSGVLCRQDGRR